MTLKVQSTTVQSWRRELLIQFLSSSVVLSMAGLTHIGALGQELPVCLSSRKHHLSVHFVSIKDCKYKDK